MRRLILVAVAMVLVIPAYGPVMANSDDNPSPKDNLQNQRRTDLLELDRKDNSDRAPGPIEPPFPPRPMPIGIGGGGHGKDATGASASASGGAIPVGSGGALLSRSAKIERALEAVAKRLD